MLERRRMARPHKILVTGGAGYIGSVLAPLLLQNGYAIRILDLFPWGVGSIAPLARNPNVELLKGDMRDEAALRTALNGVDAVINLAAIVGYPACKADPYAARTTN